MINKKSGCRIIGIILVVSYFITLVMNYSSVKENLDGWHNFSGSDANWFLFVCFIGIILTIISMIKINYAKVIMSCLTILPIISWIIIMSLKGNVESDSAYLLFRICEGFEKTFWLLALLSISFLIVSVKKEGN